MILRCIRFLSKLIKQESHASVPRKNKLLKENNWRETAAKFKNTCEVLILILFTVWWKGFPLNHHPAVVSTQRCSHLSQFSVASHCKTGSDPHPLWTEAKVTTLSVIIQLPVQLQSISGAHSPPRTHTVNTPGPLGLPVYFLLTGESQALPPQTFLISIWLCN